MALIRDLLARYNATSSASDEPLTETDAFQSLTVEIDDEALKNSVVFWKSIEDLHFRILDVERTIAFLNARIYCGDQAQEQDKWGELAIKDDRKWKRLKSEAESLLARIRFNELIPERYIAKLIEVNHIT
jgi:hypothetical protein